MLKKNPRGKLSFQELFETRFVKGKLDECWEFDSFSKDGYGRFSHMKSRYMLAHRVSYKLYVDPELSSKDIIRHKCDNRKCINPNHLIHGTMKDNSGDMMERDRGYLKYGEANPFVKLKEYQALEILKSSLSQKELANIYNVSTSAIWHIKTRSTWKHLKM